MMQSQSQDMYRKKGLLAGVWLCRIYTAASREQVVQKSCLAVIFCVNTAVPQ